MDKIDRIQFFCKREVIKMDGEDVYLAFPVDASRKDKSTPKEWASVRKRVENADKPFTYESIEGVDFEFDNKFDDIRITSLEHRGNGGRAYKAVITKDDKRFKVDLREDCLMETMMSVGIEPKGVLKGDFCFVKDNSQTKLIRCESEEYKKLIEFKEKVSKQNIIPTKELKPMTLYQSGIGNKGYILFIGEVYIPQIDIEGNGGNSYYGSRVELSEPSLVKVKKARLYLDYYQLDNVDKDNVLKNKMEMSRAKVSQTFKAHTEIFTIEDDCIKNNLISRYKKNAVKSLIEICGEYTRVVKNSYWGLEKLYMSSSRYKSDLVEACVGENKKEVLDNFEKYKKLLQGEVQQ